MYTVVIKVPFRRRDAARCEVASDWGRAIVLLRDSLAGRFGPITIAAPELPPGEGLIAEQMPMMLDAAADDVRFESLGQAKWRARQFWRAFPKTRAACDRLARESDVVHCGIDNLWQPYASTGMGAAIRQQRMIVFVVDTDRILQWRDLAAEASMFERIKNAAYNVAYTRLMRKAVSYADLSLLKGQSLHDRYGKYARNARDFYDTSYSTEDILSAEVLRHKCDDVRAGTTPVRCLTLGRMLRRKGIHHSIEAIARARKAGANVMLDVIGSGPEDAELRAQCERAGVGEGVRFLGPRTYDKDLFAEISTYHLFLFTPTAEDTPRSLFDGLAAGCGLLTVDIAFTRQVLADCRHGRAVQIGDEQGLADSLVELDRDRGRLVAWMGAAAQAAQEHTAEAWYRRRAEWTFEAFERRKTAK